ncbi:hypothetical protein FRX31_029633 [Thalictrum thalictroides]|uniref:Uncharacterized protein n=1 Tax=Thalictrum thalictroides TaxID=46969 RepID=A0A7J6V982_THATH|nr:hypothetical protein FRX31_029633 [Thalictrum thalictroides]
MTSVRTRRYTNTTNSNSLASFLGKEISNTRALSKNRATMASLLMGTMEQNNNSCKELITTLHQRDKKVSHKSNLSYFLNISFPNKKNCRVSNAAFTKVRIKIPKLFVKNAKKTEHRADGNKSSNSKKWCNPRDIPDKVTSLLSKNFVGKKSKTGSDAFGTMKLENTSIRAPKDSFLVRGSNASSRTEEEFGSQRSEIDGGILSKTVSEYSESSRAISICSAESLYSEDQPSNYSLSEVPSSKELLEEEVVKPIVFYQKGVQQKVCPTCERPLDTQSSIKSFLSKTTPLKPMKGKYSTSDSSSCSSGSAVVSSSSSRDGENKTSRKHYSKPKVWKSCSSERIMDIQVEKSEEEPGDKELCKKKILMGEKCRPLDDGIGKLKAEFQPKAAIVRVERP